MLKKLIVFGGNGYLGQHILSAAIAAASKAGTPLSIVAVNRSGEPGRACMYFDFPSLLAQDKNKHITLAWQKGDILQESEEALAAKISGMSSSETEDSMAAAISCVGAFGSNEFMLQVNGEANKKAIRACKHSAAKVQRFVYISTVENNLPSFVLRGYFEGKRAAEKELLEQFGELGKGTVLRPGFIYGTRILPGGSAKLPLGLLGAPLEAIFATAPIVKLQKSLPGMQAILAPPTSVERVAHVAVAAALRSPFPFAKQVLSVDDIRSFAL